MTKSRGIGPGGKRAGAGRPPAAPGDSRVVTLQLVVSERERATLRATAAGMGLSLSAWLRQRLGLA